MHVLSIHFGPHQLVWALLFKEKEKAESTETALLAFMKQQHFVQNTAPAQCVSVEDDYGQRAHIMAGPLHGVLLEDSEYAQEAVIQRFLHQQRTQVKAHQRAHNDPTLKFAGGMQGVPSFDPMTMRNGRMS